MKRVFLIAAGLLITAFFIIYIFGVDLSGIDNHIGHQYDTAEADITGRPAEAAAVYIAESPEGTAVAVVTEGPAGMAAASTEGRGSLNITAGQTRTGGPSETLSGWKLMWADEFAGTSVDQEYWTRVHRKNNYNNELQYYLPKNSFTEDGCLCLIANRDKRNGKNYTSGMVETRGKLLFKYGRVEVRAKLPAGKGLLPAIWMLSDDGRSEIDIMEMIGSEPNIIYGVNHYRSRGPRKTVGSITCDTPEGFHVYAAEWDKDEIRWYLDGALFHKSRKGVPSKKMYIVFTLAVGGDWPGDPGKETPFPCGMKVDYIRVYKRV